MYHLDFPSSRSMNLEWQLRWYTASSALKDETDSTRPLTRQESSSVLPDKYCVVTNSRKYR